MPAPFLDTYTGNNYVRGAIGRRCSTGNLGLGLGFVTFSHHEILKYDVLGSEPMCFSPRHLVFHW